MSDRTDTIGVRCHLCGKQFYKTIHRYKESIKNGWNFYCSHRCHSKFKNKQIKSKCSQCKKEIKIKRTWYKNSVTKNFFCSKSCAARYNNKQRGQRTLKEKENIRQGIISYHIRIGTYRKRKQISSNAIRTKDKKICPICFKEFKSTKFSQVCCSRNCSEILKFGSSSYTKEDVINGILNKYKEISRTPQRRECKSRLYSAASRLFGTWNKAIRECGLKPNSSKYQKVRLKCQDGHISDSISEMIVDDWFFSKQLKHNRNKKYFGSNMDCDFYFPDYDLWVEYFGLIGQSKEYDITVKAKRKLIKKLKLNFVELVPDDLYPSRKFESVFGHIF